MPAYETGGERSLTKNWCPDIYEHFRNVLLHSSTITVPCARYQLTSGICEIILAIITTATTNYHNYQNHSQLSQLLEIEAIPQIAKALILATLEPLEMRPGSELQHLYNKHAKSNWIGAVIHGSQEALVFVLLCSSNPQIQYLIVDKRTFSSFYFPSHKYPPTVQKV